MGMRSHFFLPQTCSRFKCLHRPRRVHAICGGALGAFVDEANAAFNA